MGVQFVLSTLGTGTPDPVNLEEIVTFTKDQDNRIQSSENKFKIVFHRGAQAPDITWKYNKEEDRDCEFDKLVTQHGQKL